MSSQKNMMQYKSIINVVELDADLQKLASNFYCGNNHIDGFLRSSEALDPSAGKTYVWLNEKQTVIIGYYNITTGSVEHIDGDLKWKAGGSVHINQFAIDNNYQKVSVEGRRYLSDLLLADCIERIMWYRTRFAGFAFVTLQSTNEGHYLYERNDFEDIEEDMQITSTTDEIECKPMYLALDIEP